MSFDFLTKDTEVIIYIEENQWTNLSEIQKNTKVGQWALNNIITKLLMQNIIEERRGDRNSREFKLTKKGERIASKLKEIQEILETE